MADEFDSLRVRHHATEDFIHLIGSGPKIRFLPYATEDFIEEIAQRCRGFPVDWVMGRGVYTPEQFNAWTEVEGNEG